MSASISNSSHLPLVSIHFFAMSVSLSALQIGSSAPVFLDEPSAFTVKHISHQLLPLCLLLFITASSVFEWPSVSYEAGDGWGIFSKRVLPNHSSRKTDTLANSQCVLALSLASCRTWGGPSFSEVPPWVFKLEPMLQVSLLSRSAWGSYLSF